MEKLLLVDDDAPYRKGISAWLKMEGYEVTTAGCGEDALNLAIRENPHIILLDVGLPDMTGFDVCRKIRERGLEPIILMVTGRGEEVDRVVGLEVGADDYVVKPYSRRELIARMRAHLRRLEDHKPEILKVYEFDDISINFERLVAKKNDEELDLTSKEFAVLQLLINSRGGVVTRDELLDKVWGFDAFPTTRTVDNHIMKLRKKLEKDPNHPRHMISIYGEGYKWID